MVAWRSGLSKSLGENIAAVLDWDESGSSPYTTDRPGYPGYSGLMIWAAYSGDDAKVAPKDIPESGWYEDPIFQKARQKFFQKARYSGLSWPRLRFRSYSSHR